MWRGTFRPLLVFQALWGSFLLAPGAAARELSFEERVHAQAALERTRYTHQIDADRSFEEAFPRALIERKVRDTLRQSAALAKYWHTPVTATMLEREVARIVHASRMPERL